MKNVHAPKLDLHIIFKFGRQIIISVFSWAQKKSVKGGKVKFKNCYLNWEKCRPLFASVIWPIQCKTFFLLLLASANNDGCDRGERYFSLSFSALFTYWHVEFSKIFYFIFFPWLMNFVFVQIRLVSKSGSAQKTAAFSFGVGAEKSAAINQKRYLNHFKYFSFTLKKKPSLKALLVVFKRSYFKTWENDRVHSKA